MISQMGLCVVLSLGAAACIGAFFEFGLRSFWEASEEPAGRPERRGLLELRTGSHFPERANTMHRNTPVSNASLPRDISRAEPSVIVLSGSAVRSFADAVRWVRVCWTGVSKCQCLNFVRARRVGSARSGLQDEKIHKQLTVPPSAATIGGNRPDEVLSRLLPLIGESKKHVTVSYMGLKRYQGSSSGGAWRKCNAFARSIH